MSVCNCQECERRRERWTRARTYVTTDGRAIRRAFDGAVIASGSPEFIAAVARNL